MTRVYAPIARAVVLLSCALSIATLAGIRVRVQPSPSMITPAAALAASAPVDAYVALEDRDDEATSPRVLTTQAVASYGAESARDLVSIDWQGRFFFTIQRK